MLDACQCGEEVLCKKHRCANCGTKDTQCEMRRSLRMVLAAGLPDDVSYFCTDCYRTEQPDYCESFL